MLLPRRSSFCLVILALLGCTGAARAAPVVVTNGNFASGDFSGWTVKAESTPAVQAAVQTPAQSGIPGQQGNVALLQSLQSLSTQAEAGAETDLGLAAGALKVLSSDSTYLPTDGTYIYQTVSGQAGDTISFNAQYLSDETLNDKYDFGFASLSETGSYQLISLGDDTTITQGPLDGFALSGLAVTKTFILPNTGTYILGFGAFNTFDNLNSSAVVIGDVGSAEITGNPGPAADAPELNPSSALTPLVLLLGGFALVSDRRRRTGSPAK